jgi:hypothetical protein
MYPKTAPPSNHVFVRNITELLLNYYFGALRALAIENHSQVAKTLKSLDFLQQKIQ